MRRTRKLAISLARTVLMCLSAGACSGPSRERSRADADVAPVTCDGSEPCSVDERGNVLALPLPDPRRSLRASSRYSPL